MVVNSSLWCWQITCENNCFHIRRELLLSHKKRTIAFTEEENYCFHRRREQLLMEEIDDSPCQYVYLRIQDLLLCLNNIGSVYKLDYIQARGQNGETRN